MTIAYAYGPNPWPQSFWDARAAANFVCGGAGAGLVVAAALLEGVRFYTAATGDHYTLTREAVADALLGMASHTVDFPRVVEKAWHDGVRVFLKHEPHGGCSRWIDRILGDRPHLAVPLDLPGVSSARQAAQALAQLIAAGVPVD